VNGTRGLLDAPVPVATRAAAHLLRAPTARATGNAAYGVLASSRDRRRWRCGKLPILGELRSRHIRREYCSASAVLKLLQLRRRLAAPIGAAPFFNTLSRYLSGARARQGRQPGSARGEVQECAAGKFHLSSPGFATFYSITSSARASSVGGTVRLSALAVLRLITSSTFVDCCTGRLAGFSPLRIRLV
jgi:hypothetical protein